MRIGAIPETLFERLALWLGLAPTPLVDTHVAFMMARTLMVAVKEQIFEHLAAEPLTAQELAIRAQTHVHATAKLLKTLVHLGYLQNRNERYSLTAVARKWVLKSSPTSLYHKMLFHFIEWDTVTKYEQYLKTGHPVSIHSTFNDAQWVLYQNAMHDLAVIASPEIVRQMPMPAGATRLLDAGGGHGHFSVSLCKRYPKLQATVLDLPEAVAAAGKLLQQEEMAARVQLMPGDVLTHAFGEEQWDVIFTGNLVHHFNEETNLALTKKIARALRPGGVHVILDFIHTGKNKNGDHLGALLDLYFSATSSGCTFSLSQIIHWQQQAGLTKLKTIWLCTVPHYVLQVGGKK